MSDASASGGPDATAIIEQLRLAPHPEGGFYREIHRDPTPDGGRAASSSIYFLLRKGERSHWHRIDATEIWHFHVGAPLVLDVVEPGKAPVRHVLGTDLSHGHRPQAVVPPRSWQAASTLGPWTLVGCTVAPAFEFAHFELAPPDWSPPRASR